MKNKFKFFPAFSGGGWGKNLQIFLLLFIISALRTVAMPQERLTVKLHHADIEQLMQVVRQQCNVGFVYDYDNIKDVRINSLELENATLQEVLNQALKNSGFYAEIQDKVVLIKRVAPQQVISPKAFPIKGRVIDSRGVGLPGVTVMIKNGKVGTTTNSEGNFTFPLVEPEGKILLFSFVGMESKEVSIKDPATFLNVELKESSETMQEVVVTGIFNRNKESFTGSSATYTTQDLKMVATSNILQSLKTLDPSFAIMESKQWGSDPNRMPDIEIRGKTSVIGLKSEYEFDPNQPLFILDGIETTLEEIVNLNMDRVASVTILKDAASTAIYGSKAANGVVVVETKSPEAGRLRVSYSGNFAIQFADLTDYNLMNAEEKLEFERLAGRYEPTVEGEIRDQIYLDELYNRRLAEIRRGVNTYWMSEPLRTVFNHSHNLYIDGGDKEMRYGLGVNYSNKNGVMIGSDRSTGGANIDLSYRRSKLLFSNKASISLTQTKREPAAFSLFSEANPYYRKSLENGYIPMILGYESEESTVINPLYYSTIKNTNESNTISLRDNFNAEWSMISSLRVRVRIGLTKTIGHAETFKSPLHPDFLEKEKNEQGSYQESSTESLVYNGDINVTFGKLFRKKHRVNFVGGWSLNENNSKNAGYKVLGFDNELHTNPAFSAGFKEGDKPSFAKQKSRNTSFFMNANYSYQNRYLLDMNLRSDGTSKFGVNKRFSTTWAFGIAWNVHQENFAKEHLAFLDNLKLRFSIGNPGNQNFDAYQAMKTYKYNVTSQNMFGTSVLIDKMGNPNLEWQRTIDKNFGLDLAIFDHRLRIVLDYYYKDTDPLLVSIKMPPSVGTTNINSNVGSQISKGMTGSMFGTVLKKQDLNWTLNLNFRTGSSEYRNIGNSLQEYNEKGSSTQLVRYYDGASPDDMWAVPSLGIDPVTGKEVFLKRDGSYTYEWSSSDEVVVGCSKPKVEGVIGSSLYYKGLSVNVSFRYQLGGQVMATALFNKVENINSEQVRHNQDRRALYNRWKNPGDKAKFVSIRNTSATQMSSRFVVDENTFTGESISLGYECSGKWIKAMGIQGFNFRAYMNDIFRLSSFKEERGIDYPFSRSITFSLGIRL